ncbi:hypothetical protein KZZ52_58100 [Dactylosporangium sp. AC04546]|uniref:hypothetical protein n=1 Tax=Dactylosporangium sp. AC04546 TaxID=2862460 RepID=UPI001EDCBF3B|nr:hypothetical protein [Dactylosporangium sp. AC04546]WVK83515.1 hypothetical protein KZZ52_58100 [Dactylosporangium sp. AC04546]
MDEPESAALTPAKRFETMFPALVALVASLAGALVGGWTTYAAAQAGNRAAADAQRESVVQARQDELTKLRIEAYRAFLTGFDATIDAQQAAIRACDSATADCETAKLHQLEVSIGLERAADGVVVYGTTAGLRLTNELILWAQQGAIQVADGKFAEYKGKRAEIRETRGEFQKQMCLDVNPAPRLDCGEIRPRPS